MVLRIIPVVLAFLMLGAHFLREGNAPLVLVCFFVPFLLLFRKRWALAGVRLLTFLGVIVWLQSTIVLVQQRWAMGAPWGRMLLIMTAVAAFTLLAAYLLSSETVRKNYR